MQQRYHDAVRQFFFANEGEEGDDHLIEVVHRDADAAASFIQLTMLFNLFGSFVACAASIAFLSLHWDRCASCDRPLRWWLLVQTFLQAVQIPVRSVIMMTVRSVHKNGGDLQETVRCLTASPAWRASKTASLVLYGWFILGFVWWVHSSKCETCPGIDVLTGAVMVLSVARAAVALMAFALLFPPLERDFDAPEESKVEGATPSQISALTLVRYNQHSDQWQHEVDPSCAVCLGEFCNGEMLRQLPCRHHFHKGCIDKWLCRNKRCPLCMAAIDEELVVTVEAMKASRRKVWPMCN